MEASRHAAAAAGAVTAAGRGSYRGTRATAADHIQTPGLGEALGCALALAGQAHAASATSRVAGALGAGQVQTQS